MSDPNPYGLTNRNSTWSSDMIVKARNSYNNSLYQWQKTNGCNLFLCYHNSNTLRLSCYTGPSSIVAFPEGHRTRIRTIYTTVSGPPNTKHYVYLTASSFFISTSAPTHRFSRMWVHAQYNAVCVGWVAFGDNWAMHGYWNVYSFYNEPTRTFAVSVTRGTTYLTLPGFIVPEGKTATLNRSGTTGAYNCGGGWGHGCWGSTCSYTAVSVGSASNGHRYLCYLFWPNTQTVWKTFYLGVSVYITVSLSHNTISDSIVNTFALYHSVYGGYWYINGELYITRIGS